MSLKGDQTELPSNPLGLFIPEAQEQMSKEDESGSRHILVLGLAPLRSTREHVRICWLLHTSVSLILYAEEEVEREVGRVQENMRSNSRSKLVSMTYDIC